MQSFRAGQDNIVTVDMKALANMQPITAGTVYLTLQAKSGTNAGKWFKASDSTWSATEQIAGTATHQARGRWAGTIISAAWSNGVRYDLGGYESGGLNIDYSDEVVEVSSPVNLTIEPQVEQ
jgi:hypothetical protein